MFDRALNTLCFGLLFHITKGFQKSVFEKIDVNELPQNSREKSYSGKKLF